jgi:hypothetical protein
MVVQNLICDTRIFKTSVLEPEKNNDIFFAVTVDFNADLFSMCFINFFSWMGWENKTEIRIIIAAMKRKNPIVEALQNRQI